MIVSEIVQSSRAGPGGRPCVGTGASYHIDRIIGHGARPDTHRHRMIVRRPGGPTNQPPGLAVIDLTPQLQPAGHQQPACARQ